ncbi:hypothetical protein Tsubulata_012916, partial [Turnera subulata]
PTLYYNLCFNTRRTQLTTTSTCVLPLDQPTPQVQPPPNDHKALCFSLADQLISRGLFPSARQVIQRIIAGSPTVPDAISAVDFATLRGMELDLGIYGQLIRKFVDSGEFSLAHSVYCDHVVGKGIEPDAFLVNSMVVCLVGLGNLEEALVLFDKLFANGGGNGNDCKAYWATCRAVFRELCVKERFLEAFECLVRINNAKVKLDWSDYNSLIDGLCKKGCLGEAMDVVDVMRERNGMVPSLHSYKSLFYGLCKGGRPVEAESIFEEIEAQGFSVDTVMYTALMNAYGKDKKMKMAMRVYFRMLKLGCEADVYAYNTLIHGFCRIGLFEKGWVLYNQMNALGLHPDIVTHHVMISSYCKKGEMDCAMDLLNDMIRSNVAPSVRSFTVLIANLYKQNRHMEANELWMQMLERGVVPDHLLFFTLMKNSQIGDELPLCSLMLQEIAKSVCGLLPPLSSASAHVDRATDLEQEIEVLFGEIAKNDLNLANVAGAIFISALCEGGNIDDALAFLGKMINIGCSRPLLNIGCSRPLLFTFNSLIKRLCQEGLFEDVMSLIDIMQGWGVAPNSITYLILVHEYCKKRDLVSAFNVLDQVEEKGLKPSVAIYDSIIGCLGREKRMPEAENLFLRMLEAGEDPDETFYMTMINAYSRNGRILEALELFEMMIQNAIRPRAYSYTALISGLVKKNMIDKGCLYLDRMLEEGFMANVALYTSLVKHFLRMGEVEFALRLVDSMNGNKIEADFTFCSALYSGLCRNIKGIKRRRIELNKASYGMREKLLYLLRQGSALPSEKKLRVSAYYPENINCLAMDILQAIGRSSFVPDLFLFNGIIAGLCWENRMEEAYNQLEKMQRGGVYPNEVTFTILIDTHSRILDIDHAISLFNMMNAAGSAPDKITYKILLKGLCRARRAFDALTLLYAMHKRGFFPSKASYENLLHSFCANYSTDAALKIFEEMITNGYVPRMYGGNWLLCLLCEEKKLREAHMMFRVLRERGKLPNELAMRYLEETSNILGEPHSDVKAETILRTFAEIFSSEAAWRRIEI